MRPPWSMILFTTLAGCAQGLLLVLVGLDLARRVGLVEAPQRLFTAGAAIVLLLSAVGLVAAVFHLGQPRRAWRAATMWRTSWLSREVIVLPAFMASVALWGLSNLLAWPSGQWGVLTGVVAAALALLLYLCTGMIYAAVKAIRAWATPMTPVNFALIGFASGALLATLLAAFTAPALVSALAVLTVCATLLAAITRGTTFWRNQQRVARTTLQTALGIRHPNIRHSTQATMNGSFSSREFFHHQRPAVVRAIRWCAAILGFGLPVLLLGLMAPSLGLVAVLWLLQLPGLLAERWSFFAEGQHTQNLYNRAAG